ncbi:fcs3 protein [Hyaloraphidium curvatum]|nr:fcs3 protein [Hyaloraphidium curvatum]
MPVLGGPMPLAEADALLAGPLGDQLGLRREKVVLPWTTSGAASRKPPDPEEAVEVFANAHRTVREVWETAARTWGAEGREYYVFHDTAAGEVVRVTYAGCNKTVVQLAHALRGMGVRRGDRVGIALRNFPEYMPIWWAAICLGAVAVPLNSWLSKPELEYCIKDCGARVLFLDQERVDRLGGKDGIGLLDTAVPNGFVERFVLVRTSTKLPAAVPAVPFASLLDPAAPSELPPADISPFDDVQIMYSSGTTGRPKGVLYHHLGMTNVLHGTRYAAARTALRNGLDVPAVPPVLTWILPVPLFHLTGIGYTYLTTGAGGRIVFVNKWDANEAVDLMAAEGVTNFMAVPTQALQLIESPRFSAAKLPKLLSLAYGGAPGPAELRTRAKKAFGNRAGAGEPSNGYGCTETLAVAANAGEDYARKPDSCGKPPPFVRVEVRDEDGTVLPADGVGEIWVRSSGIAKGYWNNPQATAASFQRGWYNTGDVGRLDAEGFLYIMDRTKDMCIRGGENVYCLEVESALMTHPAVLDAAVFGIPHRVLGEEVGAAVRLLPSQWGKVTAAELREYAASKIAKFKVPAFIDLWNEPLPANPAGKVLKRELRTAVGAKAAQALGGDFAAKL